MIKQRLLAIFVLIFGVLVAYFVYATQPGLGGNESSRHAFKLGLDLSGGTHLVYKADTSAVPSANIADSMTSLRDVIERRINLFGVSETSVQTQSVNVGNVEEERIIIDLPGITDINEAIKVIGETPLLEFKIENPKYKGKTFTSSDTMPADYFLKTDLTGRYLDRASLEFSQPGQGSFSSGAYVALQFNKEGADLFERITTENVGKIIAIYLDGAPISTPVVQSVISGGQATITGNFTPDEAKELVGRLNSGALPVPIELIGTQTVGASLGTGAVDAGVKSGIIGFIILSIFFLFWYRFPGLVGIVALAIYAVIMFALFKLIPVTLTASGIAGFIISLGIALDANILIFERMKEEIRDGRTTYDAVKAGFERAWSSIRDSNISSLITAAVLFWFGTSVIQGFALTFGLGVLVSMFSAVVISRALLIVFSGTKDGKTRLFLFGSGISK